MPHRVAAQLPVVLALGAYVGRDRDLRGTPLRRVQPKLLSHAASPRPREKTKAREAKDSAMAPRSASLVQPTTAHWNGVDAGDVRKQNTNKSARPPSIGCLTNIKHAYIYKRIPGVCSGIDSKAVEFVKTLKTQGRTKRSPRRLGFQHMYAPLKYGFILC